MIFPLKLLSLLSFLSFVLVMPCFNYNIHNVRPPMVFLIFKNFLISVFIFIPLIELLTSKVISSKKISIVIFVKIKLINEFREK